MTTSCILEIQKWWSVNLTLALNLKTIYFLILITNEKWPDVVHVSDLNIPRY